MGLYRMHRGRRFKHTSWSDGLEFAVGGIVDTRHMRSAKNVLREIECKASDDGAVGMNNYSVLRELESKSALAN